MIGKAIANAFCLVDDDVKGAEEKLIGKAIANALCLVDYDVEGAEETTMVKRWQGL